MKEMRAFGLFVAILVLVAIVVLPVHPALAQPPPPDPTRSLPDKVEIGETFDVTINFTCPADDFVGISLRDTAPDGWNVAVNGAWCDPYAEVKAVGNRAELCWIGPYFLPEDENFTAKYKVTVPCNATPGNHSFSVNYPYENMLRWSIGGLENTSSTIITGDYVLEVIGPTINFTPTSITFYGAVNGTNPLDQTLELWSSTACMLNWSLSDDADYEGHDWLSVPENGSCTDVPSSAVLSVNSSGMPGGTYFANITIDASEANNTQEIVPVTLYMSVADVLEAHVSFTARGLPGSDRWIERFEVRLFSPGTTNVVWEGNRTTNNTGWFNISDVVVGTYDVAIKNCTCLSELVSNVTVSEGAGAVVDFGTTREGDVKESDKVDGWDFALISAAYNAKPIDGNWNANADLNRSGKVDGWDFALLSGNYNDKGDAFGCF